MGTRLVRGELLSGQRGARPARAGERAASSSSWRVLGRLSQGRSRLESRLVRSRRQGRCQRSSLCAGSGNSLILFPFPLSLCTFLSLFQTGFGAKPRAIFVGPGLATASCLANVKPEGAGLVTGLCPDRVIGRGTAQGRPTMRSAVTNQRGPGKPRPYAWRDCGSVQIAFSHCGEPTSGAPGATPLAGGLFRAHHT